MRGRLETRTWLARPDLYAPARYRRSCSYEAFVPIPLQGSEIRLPGDVAGVVSDAEAAIHALNAQAQPALQPLARLLLRTEAVASSRVEGMQMNLHSLARAEAKQEQGRRVGGEASEILANLDAMQLAVDEASSVERLRLAQIQAIHHELLQDATGYLGAGIIRLNRIGSAATTTTRAAPISCRRRPEELPGLLRRSLRFLRGRVAAAARAGGDRPRAIRDHPPVQRRERANGQGPRAGAAAAARPCAGVRAADQRRPRGRQGQVHQGSRAVPRR